MKVLVAVDRSPCSDRAVDEVGHHAWPPGTEFEVVSVAHTRVPLIPEPMCFLVALHESALDDARERAARQVKQARARLVAALPASRVTTSLLEGAPAKQIVEEARRWHADLIVLGTHGRGALGRMLLGSVSRAVSRRAPCQVDVVRRCS